LGSRGRRVVPSQNTFLDGTAVNKGAGNLICTTNRFELGTILRTAPQQNWCM